MLIDIKYDYKGLSVPNTTHIGGTFAGWVAPDGTILICGVICYNTMHYDMAIEVMGHFYGKKYDYHDYDSHSQAQHDLILEGWVRLDWQMTYFTTPITPAQVKVVDGAREVWEDMKVLKYDNHFDRKGNE